jgi:4'-phosphopantetheinyl transferase
MLYFNLAYSEDLVIYALSGDCELGIDVERVRELPDLMRIAKHFFAEPEYRDLMKLTLFSEQKASSIAWTRKEAFLKALGNGLSVPLSDFQVSLAPGQPAAFHKLNDKKDRLCQWTLLHLQPAPGYVGALAAPISRCFVFCVREEIFYGKRLSRLLERTQALDLFVTTFRRPIMTFPR